MSSKSTKYTSYLLNFPEPRVLGVKTQKRREGRSLIEDSQEAMRELDVISKKVIRMRFGLDSGKMATIKEISRKLDLSTSKVEQIIQETLRTLAYRKALKK